MDLELRHCEHALALAEHRNFERAARALGITQPSLSRSIQQLEQRVGSRLFHRGRDGVEPSDAGRVFLERARTVLVHATDLQREMRLMRGLEIGELRVGAGAYPSEMFVADAAAVMLREHPSIRISVVTNEVVTLLQQLRRRELDLVIGDARSGQAQADVHVESLCWHEAHVVVRRGHPLTGAASPKWAEVLSHPLVLTTRVPPDLLAALHQARGRGPETRGALPAIHCDSPWMMRRIVAASDAVALMPRCLIAPRAADEGLVALGVQAPWLGRHFAIIRLSDRTLSPAAVRFVEYLKQSDAAAAAVPWPPLAAAATPAASKPATARRPKTSRG